MATVARAAAWLQVRQLALPGIGIAAQWHA
jgi:hypothetical protein